MSSKRYPEEFRIEAVKQVTERGHAVADVATRIAAHRACRHSQPNSTTWSVFQDTP